MLSTLTKKFIFLLIFVSMSTETTSLNTNVDKLDKALGDLVAEERTSSLSRRRGRGGRFRSSTRPYV